MRWILLAMILCIGMMVSTGCVSESEYVGNTNHVVNQKFQSVSPCGYASATTYYILDASGETVRIATTCGGGYVEMEYYWVWDAAQPGDTITIVRDKFDRITNITIVEG
jgi:hypothetical protein